MARMNRPAPVEVQYKNMRFLITHNPTNATMEKFIEMLRRYEADTVVRVCESTYDKESLTSKGIQVMHTYVVLSNGLCKIQVWWKPNKRPFDRISLDFQRLTDRMEMHKTTDWAFDDGAPPPNSIINDWLMLLQTHVKQNSKSCIAVHCVAGLGRAPVLVAVALMESGMKYEDAVDYIRQRRKGAINAKQLQYLEKYRPRYCLKIKDNGKQGCIIH